MTGREKDSKFFLSVGTREWTGYQMLGARV